MGVLEHLTVGENETISPETLKDILKTKYIKEKTIYALLDAKAEETAKDILKEISENWENREHSNYYYGERTLTPILSVDGDTFFGKKLSTRFRYAYVRVWDLSALYRSSTHTVTLSIFPNVGFFSKKFFRYFYKKLKSLLKQEKVTLSFLSHFFNEGESTYSLHYVFLPEKNKSTATK